MSFKRMTLAQVAPCSKADRRLAGRSFEKVAEGRLIAETECRRDIDDALVRGGQEESGLFQPSMLEVFRERFAHRAVEQVRAVFFRISEKLGQELERHPPMDVIADEVANFCRQALGIGEGFPIRGHGIGQVEELADRLQELLFGFRLRKAHGPLRSPPAQLGRDIVKPVLLNHGVRRSGHAGNVSLDGVRVQFDLYIRACAEVLP